MGETPWVTLHLDRECFAGIQMLSMSIWDIKAEPVSKLTDPRKEGALHASGLPGLLSPVPLLQSLAHPRIAAPPFLPLLGVCSYKI